MSYDDEIAGIVVRYQGERGFRFHGASKAYDALEGHVLATPAAAERAARALARAGFPRAGAGPISRRSSRPRELHVGAPPMRSARRLSG